MIPNVKASPFICSDGQRKPGHHMLRATLMGFIAPRSGGLLTAMMRDVPGSYDCEASCIGGLPIEIGWAFIDTATGEIQSESHLVKPRRRSRNFQNS
jgi:hypothetical protein